MTYYVVKLLLSAAIVVATSETAKRSGYWGGVLASLPLVSILALTWVYIDTHDSAKVAVLAKSTLWFVIPSLPFFLVLPWMLQSGRSFPVSMLVAATVAAIAYILTGLILQKVGVRL